MTRATYPAPTGMFIDGEWVQAVSGDTIPVENPATKEVFAHVPRGGSQDCDLAVAAAQRSFGSWKAMPARERGRILWQIGDSVEQHSEELARLIATETGNAIRTQARGEANTSADIFRYFGGAASEMKGETLPFGSNLLSYSVREPLGVVGGIIAWNGPVQLATLKISMALATGNTLVLKAAEDAPLAVLRLAEICAEWLPKGTLNVITGTGEEAGAALAKHPGIAMFTFTGSTEVGKSIMREAAARTIPVSLELGGKSPAIVFADADDDATAAGVITGMRFTRQGQSCTAGSRLLLHRSIFDSFLDRLKTKLAQLRIGDPLDEATDMGALINRIQFERVSNYISSGLESGARALIGGMPEWTSPLSQGYYHTPTLLTGVDPDWRVSREEIFGPVLVVIPWTDLSEAIRMANDTHYGLAAYVWSHDLERAICTANALDAGWIQINRGGGQMPGMSYGGVKQSGMGREYSIEGALDSFTSRKSITIALHD